VGVSRTLRRSCSSGSAASRPRVAQALHQARQLGFVAPAVGGEVTLRGAGVAAEIAEHLAVHVRDGMRAIAQRAVLQRAVLVHDGMHQLQHIVLRSGRMVDSIN